MKETLFLLMAFFSFQTAFAQEVISLYPTGVPGLKQGVNSEKITKTDITRIELVTHPTIEIYIPKEKSSDAAVIICPGGGYGLLAYDHEGTKVAEWYNQRGMTAVVLKYRLPERDLFDSSEIRPLEDAQTAIRWVRKNAGKYKLNPNKIGIMGFSAGGHLAATASTLFGEKVGEHSDSQISARPDFSVLIYPVISMDDDITHKGSRKNLLGTNPSPADLKLFSPEKQVTLNTPPAFLVSTEDDMVVPENSIRYFLACKQNKVPAVLHIYEKGGHGYSLTHANRGLVETWPQRMEEWLKSRQLLK